jgi:hypothetical protein
VTLVHALDPVDEFLVENELVEGLMASGDIAVLYGAPKTGKSFLAVDLAVALSNGDVWFDRSISPAKVLYWAGEDFSGLIARRAACTRHKGGCGVFSIGNDPLSLVPSQAADTVDALTNVLRYELAPSRLEDPNNYVSLPSVLIIDTWAMLTASMDENSGKDMSAAMAALRELQARVSNLTIIIIHHSGKDGSRGMRGHSSLLAAVDVAIEVDKSSKGMGRWTVRNARRNPTGDSGQFRLKQVALPASELSTAGVRMETCIIEQVDGVAENCKLSDKAMQALDRLKSLEGGNAGKTCEAAPHGVAVNLAFFKAHLKETIFVQSSNDARRKGAERAVTQLINAEKIGRLDGLVWTL